MKQRVRSPFFLFVAAAFAAYLAYYMIPILHCYWTGKTVDGEIARYVPGKDDEGRTFHQYIVVFDGHQALRRFRSRRAIGQKFPVTYRDGEPASMIKGSTNDSVPSIVRQNVNPYVLAALVFFGIVALAAGLGWGQRVSSVTLNKGDHDARDDEGESTG